MKEPHSGVGTCSGTVKCFIIRILFNHLLMARSLIIPTITSEQWNEELSLLCRRCRWRNELVAECVVRNQMRRDCGRQHSRMSSLAKRAKRPVTRRRRFAPQSICFSEWNGLDWVVEKFCVERKLEAIWIWSEFFFFARSRRNDNHQIFGALRSSMGQWKKLIFYEFARVFLCLREPLPMAIGM